LIPAVPRSRPETFGAPESGRVDGWRFPPVREAARER